MAQFNRTSSDLPLSTTSKACWKVSNASSLLLEAKLLSFLVYKSINNHKFLPLHVIKSVCLGSRAYRKACPVNTSQPSTIVVTVRADWAVTSWIFYLDVSKISLMIGMLSCESTGFFSCSSNERMIWFKAVLFFLCRIIWQVILISNTENYVDVPCLTNRKWNDSKVMQHIRCVGFALHKLG